MRRVLIATLVAMVAALGLVAAAVPADAQAGQLGGGTGHGGYYNGYTQVDLDPAVYSLIAGAGITPAPIRGAKAFAEKGTLAAQFPITGYTFFPLTIKHRGGLLLTKGSASLSLSALRIDLFGHAVSARVVADGTNVGRVTVFNLTWSARPDLGLLGLTLTSAAADALDSTFGVSAFSTGATFGYATPKPFGFFPAAVQRATHGAHMG